MKRTSFVISLFVFVLIISTMATSVYGHSSSVGLIVNGRRVNPEREIIIINGQALSPARTTFDPVGAVVDWYESEGRLRIKNERNTVEMWIGSLEAYVNGTKQSLSLEPTLVKGTVMVPVRFIAESLGIEVDWDNKNRDVIVGKASSSVEVLSRKDGSRYRVVIDAGHGGKDPGAIHNGMYEKHLNLDIAKRLEALLKQRGISTYMTRSNDTYPGLYTRAQYANKVNADLFISIHNNAGRSSYSGSMTLYYPSNSRRFNGKDFASIVQKELVNKLGAKNNGIIPRPKLVVLRETKMPAVIAEIGFMTNKNDAASLKTAEYRQKAAEALESAIIKALKQIK